MAVTSPSIAAAHLSADCTAALLLHADEGHLGDVDVVAKLAEALALSIDIELERAESCDTAYRAGLAGLRGAADAYLEAFSG